MKEDKLKKFIHDETMSGAVYDILLDSFLKERTNADVYVLAASRLAVDYLKQGWNELEKYKIDEGGSSPPLRQVGL